MFGLGWRDWTGLGLGFQMGFGGDFWSESKNLVMSRTTQKYCQLSIARKIQPSPLLYYRSFAQQQVFPTCSPSTFLKYHYISKLIFPEVQHQCHKRIFLPIFMPSTSLGRPKYPRLAFPFSRSEPASPILKRHFMTKLKPSNLYPLIRTQVEPTTHLSSCPSLLPNITAPYLQSLFFLLIIFQLLLNNQNSIPMTSSYLKKPILSKKIDYKCLTGLAYTSCQMQGWRTNMEDSLLYQEITDGVHLFAVFDGHGGPEVSHYAAQLLPKELVKDQNFKNKNYGKALTSTFKKIDEIIESARGEEELTVISKRLGVTTQGGEKIGYRAGTTAVVLLITKNRYYVANIGDSRAVLSRANTAIPLSFDHKPDLPSEKERIEKAGGYVKMGRVNGSLSLSRSFGDFEYKHFSDRSYEEQAVTSLPDVIELQRNPADNFIMLACDGVWQKYVSNNQKMVDRIKQLRDQQNDKKLVMDKLFNDLVARELKQVQGCDNMSAILIELF